DEGLVVDEMNGELALGLQLVGDEDIGRGPARILAAGVGGLQAGDSPVADLADEALVVVGLAGAVALVVDGVNLDRALAAVEDMQEQPAVVPVRLPEAVELRLLDRGGWIARGILRFRYAGGGSEDEEDSADQRQQAMHGGRIVGTQPR